MDEFSDDERHVDRAVRELLADLRSTEVDEVRDREFARLRLDELIAHVGRTAPSPARRASTWRRRPWALAVGIAVAMLLVGGTAAATMSTLFRDGDRASEQASEVGDGADAPDAEAEAQLRRSELDELRPGTGPGVGTAGMLRPGTAQRVLALRRGGLDVELFSAATTGGWVCMVVQHGDEQRSTHCQRRFTASEPVITAYSTTDEGGWLVAGLSADVVRSVVVEVGGIRTEPTHGTNAFVAHGVAGSQAPGAVVVTLQDGSAVRVPILTSEPEGSTDG